MATESKSDWGRIPNGLKHGGLSVPYVALNHANYFHYCLRYMSRWGIRRADEVAAKSRTIKVGPRRVVYEFDWGPVLTRVYTVPADEHVDETDHRLVRPYLDMSVIDHVVDRHGPRRDADALLKSAFKKIVMGDAGYRLTQQRCESFFDDDDNFAARPGRQRGFMRMREPSWSLAYVPGEETSRRASGPS